MSAGTYRITVGDVFYIGSSKNLNKRRLCHQADLRNHKGHPNKRLAAAFAKHETYSWLVTDYLARWEGESDEAFRDRLRVLEQRRLDDVKGHPNLANASGNSRGPDARDDMKRRWENPEYREMMSGVQKWRLRNGVPETTREKMAEAKRGGNNPKAREVEVMCPDGNRKSFGSATEAAQFFGVSQQAMDLWIRGVVPWPNGHRTRNKNKWIAAYRLINES